MPRQAQKLLLMKNDLQRSSLLALQSKEPSHDPEIADSIDNFLCFLLSSHLCLNLLTNNGNVF